MFLFLKYLLALSDNNIFYKKKYYWYSNFNKVRKISAIEDSISLLLKNNNSINNRIEAKVAVLCHLYYIDLWKEFRNYLKNIEIPFDLYVNLVEGSSSYPQLIKIKKNIERLYPAATVIISDNRGLDIGGTLTLINFIIEKKIDYDLFLKIHSKKSFQSTTKTVGKRWRHELLNSLLGSPFIVNGILTLFKENGKLGMVGSKTWHIKAVDNFYFAVGANESGIKYLCNQFNIREVVTSLEFIGGTMFWIDAKIVINKLKLLNLNIIINNLEVGYFRDNQESTRTHSMERVFGLIILDEKKEIITI